MAAIIATMDAIAAAHPDLAAWYRTGWSRKKALEHPVPAEGDAVRKVLTQNRTDFPPREVIEALGWSFSVWNGGPEEGSHRRDVHFGVTSPRVLNSVIVGLPAEIIDDDGWARDLMIAIQHIWTPDEIGCDAWRPSPVEGERRELVRVHSLT